MIGNNTGLSNSERNASCGVWSVLCWGADSCHGRLFGKRQRRLPLKSRRAFVSRLTLGAAMFFLVVVAIRASRPDVTAAKAADLAASVAGRARAWARSGSETREEVDISGPALAGVEPVHLPKQEPAFVESRRVHTEKPMSIVVLFHNEYDSLLPVLDSWIDGGLLTYADDVLFFLNGVAADDEFRKRVTALDGRIPPEKVRVVPQEPNLALGIAISKMVELAKHEYVLLLEKDWLLVEPHDVAISRLNDSKVLLGSGQADLVRHRHRDNPGVPIHALIMHAGREESILRQQPNLLCFVHHWQKDPTIAFPGHGRMRRCGGRHMLLDEEDVFCTPARFCQWTNNPGIFKRSWFLSELAGRFLTDYEKERKEHGEKSPFLDFEYYTNWREYSWNARNFTVATGAGLFSHSETEHRHFNTFWYAFYRLRTDLEEIRNDYLRNETRFKSLGGVHQDPQFPIPPMVARYPTDFVRQYQVPSAFTGGFVEQKELIEDLYLPYLEKYRVLHATSTQMSRAEVAKSKLPVPWRTLITNMHFATEKAMMLAPPEQPHEMTITLVSCLLDLDRHTVDRNFDMYMEAMLTWLTHEYSKVVYTSEDIGKQLLGKMSKKAIESTKFVYTSRQELRTKWVGADNYERIQEIRVKDSWRKQASWLAGSPQSLLADYNPLVMSKMFMLRDAARNNFWNTSHFLFVDAKHNCQNPKKVTPRSDHIFRAHMFQKLLLTCFDYTPVAEVHGFEYKAFNGWLNLRTESPVTVSVGRGGVIGGSRFVIEALTAMYDVALTASLREGLMGTEENILSILMAQVPQYIDPFSNTWGCRKSIEHEHKCATASPHYNCGIFVWAAENSPASNSTVVLAA